MIARNLGLGGPAPVACRARRRWWSSDPGPITATARITGRAITARLLLWPAPLLAPLVDGSNALMLQGYRRYLLNAFLSRAALSGRRRISWNAWCAAWPRAPCPSIGCGNFSGSFRPGRALCSSTELERAVLRGDEIPGGDMLSAGGARRGARLRRAARRASALPRARSSVRSSRSSSTPKVTARRPAASRAQRLEPIWTWICARPRAGEAKVYCDDVSRALAGGDIEPPDRWCIRSRALATARMRTHARRRASRTRRRGGRMSHLIAMPDALDAIRDMPDDRVLARHARPDRRAGCQATSAISARARSTT